MIFGKGERGSTVCTTSEHFSQKRRDIGVLATFVLLSVGIPRKQSAAVPVFADKYGKRRSEQYDKFRPRDFAVAAEQHHYYEQVQNPVVVKHIFPLLKIS